MITTYSQAKTLHFIPCSGSLLPPIPVHQPDDVCTQITDELMTKHATLCWLSGDMRPLPDKGRILSVSKSRGHNISVVNKDGILVLVQK